VHCHGENGLTGSYASWDVRIFIPTGVNLSLTDGIDGHFSSYSPTKTVVPGLGGDTVIYELLLFRWNRALLHTKYSLWKFSNNNTLSWRV